MQRGDESLRNKRFGKIEKKLAHFPTPYTRVDSDK